MGPHDMANEMYTTKMCDVASRLHKMEFIREYLTKFNWLEFDPQQNTDKIKVEQLSKLLQRTIEVSVSNLGMKQIL
jgi:hypothetical protein